MLRDAFHLFDDSNERGMTKWIFNSLHSKSLHMDWQAITACIQRIYKGKHKASTGIEADTAFQWKAGPRDCLDAAFKELVISNPDKYASIDSNRLAVYLHVQPMMQYPTLELDHVRKRMRQKQNDMLAYAAQLEVPSTWASSSHFF